MATSLIQVAGCHLDLNVQKRQKAAQGNLCGSLQICKLLVRHGAIHVAALSAGLLPVRPGLLVSHVIYHRAIQIYFY